MQWVLSHMDEDDFNEPLAAAAAAEGPAPDKDSLAMLVSMGFTETQAAAALKVRNAGGLQCSLLWRHQRESPGLNRRGSHAGAD